MISFISSGNNEADIILQPFVISNDPIRNENITSLKPLFNKENDLHDASILAIYLENTEKNTMTPPTVNMLIIDLYMAELNISLKLECFDLFLKESEKL